MDPTESELILPEFRVNQAIYRMVDGILEIGTPLTFVIVLKGGSYVAYKILHFLSYPVLGVDADTDIIVGHIGLSSYQNGTKSTGSVKTMSPFDLSTKYIEGRNAVIIDDCVETGKTLYWAKRMIQAYNPKSFSTAVLVDKSTLREKEGVGRPDIVGYEYKGEKFLFGCGMGLDERYRGLPMIYGFNCDS